MKVVVNIKDQTQAVRFVSICSKYKLNIDLQSGKYIVDGKSILGVVSLNSNQSQTVHITGGKSEELSALIDELQSAGFFQNKKSA